MAELVDALDSKSSSFGSVGSIPTLSTNKSPIGENTSEFQKEARFFFEIKRGVFFGDFQSDALWELP